jgi:nickel transport protein
MSHTLPAVLIGLFVSAQCGAHDLWIERDGPRHTLAYGHERSAHEGAKSLEYKAVSVKGAECVDTAGNSVKSRFTQGFPATLNGDCAASLFHVSSGYWSKTPYGTKNLPKDEAGAVLDSWLSMENVKRIDRWGPGLDQPVADGIEIVPLDNPLSLRAGDKLRLRVYLNKKPQAGVTVAYFGKPRGVSGADGVVNVRLASPGFQLLQASLELPSRDPRADKTIHAASLQFDLP